MDLKFVLALFVASALGSNTCYVQLNTFSKEDTTCSGQPINEDRAFFNIDLCEWSDDVVAYVRVPFCREDVGVSLYLYEDLECKKPLRNFSPDFGCPADGCCHLSGERLFDRNAGMAMAMPYTMTVL